MAIPAMFLACSVTALCRLKLSLQITSVPISLFILNLFCILCCLLYDKYRLVARLPSGGCVSDHQRRKGRGAEGVGARGGVPPPQKIFEF